MASSLKNKSTVCMLWKVPEHGVQAMRDFFEFHFEYMKEKMGITLVSNLVKEFSF